MRLGPPCRSHVRCLNARGGVPVRGCRIKPCVLLKRFLSYLTGRLSSPLAVGPPRCHVSAAGSRHRCWDWCCPSRPAAVQVWRRGALHRLTSKLSFQSTFPGAVLSGHQTSCWTGPALLQCRGRSCLAMQTLLVAVTPQRRPQADTLVHHLTRQQAYSAASRTTKDSISSQPHTRGRGHGGWGVGRGQRELARLWLCRSAAA